MFRVVLPLWIAITDQQRSGCAGSDCGKSVFVQQPSRSAIAAGPFACLVPLHRFGCRHSRSVADYYGCPGLRLSDRFRATISAHSANVHYVLIPASRLNSDGGSKPLAWARIIVGECVALPDPRPTRRDSSARNTREVDDEPVSRQQLPHGLLFFQTARAAAGSPGPA